MSAKTIPVSQAAPMLYAAPSSGTPSQTQTNIPADAKPGTVLTIPNCVQPPNNLDHATFTDAQLAKYGMPSRSSFPTFAAFARAVRAMKHRSCHFIVGSADQLYDAVKATKANIANGELMKTSHNWGGYSEYAGNWTASDTEWTVPALQNCTSAHPGRDALWGGIGGVGSNNLVQSGTTDWCFDPNAGNPNAAYYQAWVENLGDVDPKPMYAGDWQPKPGDEMQSFVGGSNGCNYMDVTDFASNNYYTKQYGPCGQQNYFDCVEENDNYGLANDGVVTVSFCEGYDQVQNNWLVMGNPGSTFTDWTMVNQTTDASTHSPPNGNGYGNFTVRWLAYN